MVQWMVEILQVLTKFVLQVGLFVLNRASTRSLYWCDDDACLLLVTPL